jgi:hypothetical protein
MLKLFTIPLVIAMLANLAEVNFAQLGEQISENYALIMENAENAPKPPPNQNSQGNQNNQGGNSQGGGGGRGGSGGSQPPVEPDETFTVGYARVGDPPTGFSYPPITLVESRQELEEYYNDNNFWNGLFGTLDDFGESSFRAAMDSYDDAYFEKNVLVIVPAWTYGNYFESVDVDFGNSVIRIVRKSTGAFLYVHTWHFLFGFPKKNVQSTDFTVSWIDETD